MDKTDRQFIKGFITIFVGVALLALVFFIAIVLWFQTYICGDSPSSFWCILK
jgi:hypothetical protein